MRAGASGFLLKDVPARQLAAAAPRTPVSATPGLDELTPRELEVFRLIATGMTNREIADHLIVDETTVKTHVTRILMKLGVRDRVQAVVLAYETGLVNPSHGTGI
jgi:DNA-binding NarL/FixJ family response regulator